MDINKRQPSSITSRFAESNLINHKLIDGNNILEVIEASENLIKNARNKKGPGLIEAVTYRWFGHVDWREDIDVGTNRCKETLEQWKKRCPIKRLRNSLLEQNIISEKKLIKIKSEIINQVNIAWGKAMEDPHPKEDSLLSNVFFENND